MKKLSVLLVCTLFIVAYGSSAWAGWVLYDDFQSGNIDLTKWDVDNSSADITVEAGRAKFVHNSGFPDDSAWLKFTDSPETILGIMVDITVESCSGDVRGRVSGYLAKSGENYVLNRIQVRSDRSRVDGGVSVHEPVAFDRVSELHWHNFQNPIPILGETFRVAISLHSLTEGINYVQGLGQATYDMTLPMTPNDNFFRGIGTRSNSGDGPCTVYFDNVRVFR